MVTFGDARSAKGRSIRSSWKTSSWLATVVVGIAAVPLAAVAAPPCVSFDVTDIVAAKEVTTAEFAATYPDEKLMAMRFQISSLVRFGQDGAEFQYLYVIDNPTRSLRIVDCDPKTELATDVTGSVQVQGNLNRQHSLDVNLNAGWPTVGDVKFNGQSSGNHAEQYHYEVLPPQHVVAASGTTNRGAGAYFKLVSSPRAPLDGTREFGLVLRVPRNWRADYLRVRCAAYDGSARDTSNPIAALGPGDAEPVCGSASFLLTVYQAGDGEARRAAEDFLASEQRLREVSWQFRRSIAERQYPSLADKLGAVLAVAEPKIPSRWLDEVIHGSHHRTIGDYAERLPEPVRIALADFLTKRRQLRLIASSRIESAQIETGNHAALEVMPAEQAVNAVPYNHEPLAVSAVQTQLEPTTAMETD
ncbi:MAG: hypothetical protein U0795_09620 [Pirellulales bacterium]